MRVSRREVLGAGAVAVGAGIAGCGASPPSVPSIDDAPGVSAGATGFAYEADGMAFVRRPELVLGQVDSLAKHADQLAAPAQDLVAHEPLSTPVADAVDLSSLSTYAKVQGARVFVGVDAAAARETLEAHGEARTADGVTYYVGDGWAAALTGDAVVEAAAPLVRSADAREQYVRTIPRARAGDVDRLVEVHEPSKQVMSALPACQYVDLSPALSNLNFEAEVFGVSVRGEQTVLVTARVAVPRNDPSKRNARLNTVDRWESRLAPDASISNVTVVKDDQLVRVTGTVPTPKVTLDS
jgi:hypothetical protein